MDIEHAVRETLSTLEDLTGVLDAETETLRQRQVGALGPHVDRKLALSNALNEQFATLHKRRPEFTALAARRPELAAVLESTWARFTVSLEANARALRNAEIAARRVMDLVVDSARREQQAAAGYAQPAGYGRGPGHARSAARISIGVNRKL